MFRVAVRARPDDHYAFPIESIVKKEITRGTVKKNTKNPKLPGHFDV